VLLLPFQITDVKDANNPVIINSGNTSTNGGNGIAFIDVTPNDQYDTPRMPKLKVQFMGCPAGLTVQWRFHSTFPRPNGHQTTDDRNFPDSDENGVAELPGNQAWDISQYYTNPDQFFGGSCTIYYTLLRANRTTLGPEQSMTFRIQGHNPDSRHAAAYIQSLPDCRDDSTHNGKWYATWIGEEESAQDPYILNQFNSPKASSREGKLYDPCFGSPSGWGMFQRDDHEQGIFVDTDQVWNWQVNAQVATQQEMAQKETAAANYVDNIAYNNPTTFEEPEFFTSTPGHTAWGVPVYGQTALAITLYNGSGGLSYSQILHFDPTKPAGHRWTFTPPNAPGSTEPYINKVMERYNADH